MKYLILSTLSGFAAAANYIPIPFWKKDFYVEPTSNAFSTANPVDLCGGLGTLMGVVGVQSQNVLLSYPQRAYGVQEYSTMRLHPLDGNMPGFAVGGVACVSEDDVGKTVFVPRTSVPAYGLFVFKGSWSSWTQTQLIIPEADEQIDQSYGSAIVSDKYSNRRIAVGCHSCSDPHRDGFDWGRVYLYEPDADEKWSQTQIIELDYTTLNGYNAFLGRDEIALYDDILVASYNDGSSDVTGIWMRGPNGKYNLEQTLNLPPSDVAVWEDTVVIGDAGTRLLYVYNSDKGTPAKPRPRQWSLQQTLSAGVGYGSSGFGGMVVMEKDTILGYQRYQSVASPSSLFTTFNKQSSLLNSWSQQQMLSPQRGWTDALPRAVMHQNTLLAASPSAGAFEYFNSTNDISCVQIAVSDTYGDGWDGATLLVTAPGGRHDEFASSCASMIDGSSNDDTLNTGYDTIFDYYVFEYCPKDHDQKGIYKFKIINAETAKYNWEIKWALKVDTDIFYYGDKDTELTFNFDLISRRFLPIELRNLVPPVSECKQCVTSPPPHITDSSGDMHWLDIHYGDTRRHLALNTDSWLFQYGRSASVTFVDKAGHKLLHSIDMCLEEGVTTATLSCWVPLLDGEYEVRMNTALYGEVVPIFTSTLCDAVLDKQDQMTFSFNESRCYKNAVISRDAFCSSLDVQVNGLGVFTLANINIESLGDLTTAELEALELAVSSILSEHYAISASVISVTNGNEFAFRLTFAASSFGVTLQQGQNIETLTELFAVVESDVEASNRLMSLIRSAGSFPTLSAAQAAEVVSFKVFDSKPYSANNVDLVTNVAVAGGQMMVAGDAGKQEPAVIAVPNVSESVFSNKQVVHVVLGMCAMGVVAFLATRFYPIRNRKEDSYNVVAVVASV